MHENILQYLWQFGHFEKKDLQTTDNKPITIHQLGFKNVHQGPDFSEAKIMIDNFLWAGSVEIHIRSSDWLKHQHEYENVILHVVYENDIPINYKNGKNIPTLELKNYINISILKKCEQLLASTNDILCGFSWDSVKKITKTSMYDKVLAQRLERKAADIFTVFKQNEQDWEQTSYRFLLQNFGFKTNAEAFVRLAELLPYKIIQKQKDNRIQIEALMFGMSGFLSENSKDDYQNELAKEFEYLSKKFNLVEPMNKSEWKFFRLRLPNFPTVKLAQLAGILQNCTSLHSKILECKSITDIKKMLQFETLPYWQKHYDFGKISKTKNSTLGTHSLDNVLINTVCQIKSAYGIWKDDESYVSDAIQLLESLKAENNFITRKWSEFGYEAQTAYDSQSQIELYTQFCQKKKCLECSIGVEIINQKHL